MSHTINSKTIHFFFIFMIFFIIGVIYHESNSEITYEEYVKLDNKVEFYKFQGCMLPLEAFKEALKEDCIITKNEQISVHSAFRKCLEKNEEKISKTKDKAKRLKELKSKYSCLKS